MSLLDLIFGAGLDLAQMVITALDRNNFRLFVMTTSMMKTFKIGSHRTFYKILTFAGVQVKGFTKKKGQKNESEWKSQVINNQLFMKFILKNSINN